MSAPQPPDSIWQRILYSRNDTYVWIRFVLLAALLGLGAFGVSRLIAPARKNESARQPQPLPDPPQVANPNGGLAISSSQLDFGEVWEHPLLEIPLTLENPTAFDVQVEGWSGGDRFEVVPPQVVVPSNVSTDVHVRFDPVVGRHVSDVFEVAEFERRFRPQIAGEPGNHPGWTLQGRVKRGIAVSNDLLQLSKDPLPRGAKFPTKSVDVMSLRPVKSLTAEYDAEQLVVEITGPDIRNWFKVSVTPAESISSGDQTLPVTMQAELRDGTLVETDFDVHVNVE